MRFHSLNHQYQTFLMTMKKASLKLMAVAAAIMLLSSCASDRKDSEGGKSLADRRNFERSDNAEIEKKIDELLSEMTLAEKIGQMTQINNSQIVTSANWGSGAELSIEIAVDTAKLGDLLRKYHEIGRAHV